MGKMILTQFCMFDRIMFYAPSASHCRNIVRQLLGWRRAWRSKAISSQSTLSSLDMRGNQNCYNHHTSISRFHPCGLKQRIRSGLAGKVCWNGQGASNRARLVCLSANPRGYTHDIRNDQTCHFSSLPVERSGEKRKDAEVYFKNDKARVLIFVNGKAVLARYNGDNAKMSFWLGGDDVNEIPKNAEGSNVEFVPFVLDASDVDITFQGSFQDPGNVFLGIWKRDQETPVFARDIKSISEDFLTDNGLVLLDARSAAPTLCGEDASLLALSNGILAWHRNAQFCSKTGERASEIILGGHGRRVMKNADGKRRRAIYPRIDPAVIVVAMHGDWFLLGRKSSWEKGRYSLLAGFVELGETLEEASVREVFEESGVKLCVNTLEYQRSQPWPFPQSLMVGFKGETTDYVKASVGFDLLSKEGQIAAKHSGLLEEEINAYQSHLTLPEIHVDQEELEDARFFHYSWLLEHTNNNTKDEFRIPGKHALANRLINENIDNVRSDCMESCPELNHIPDIVVPLESSCRMKYILLRVSYLSNNGSWRSKLILRGDPRAAYHNHIFTATKSEIASIDQSKSVHLDVLGGGRIHLDACGKSISVYGFSAAFGQAPHEISGAILRARLPFHSISVSFEGY